MYHAIVIGAGPAGSTAALEIARAGFRPLIVEKQPSPGARKPCGGGMPWFLARALDLPDEIIEAKVSRSIFLGPWGRTEIAAGSPTHAAARRSRLDPWLAGRAVEAGAELRTGWRAVGADMANGRVTIEQVRPGGDREGRPAREEIAARVVVFADGARTLARRACGIGGEPDGSSFLALTAEIEAEPPEGEAFLFWMDPAELPYGYGWIFPGRGTLNVGIGAIRSELGSEVDLRARLERFLARWPALRRSPVRSYGAGWIPSRVAQRLAARRAVVVGDAAGMVNPLTGGGLVYTVKSGEVAGRVVAEALRRGEEMDEAALALYPRRFRRTRHFAWLALMRGLFVVARQTQARTGRSIYPAMLRGQFHLFRAASRLVGEV